MRTAVVIGAGGAGREIAAWYRAANPDAELLGFLDVDDTVHGQTRGDLRILDGTGWLTDHDVDDVVIGVGTPAERRRVDEELVDLGLTPATVIHPTATVGERVTIGPGAIVSPNVVLTVDIRVGRGVYLNYGALVGHDTTVGDYAFVAPGAAIAGNVIVGDGVWFGIGASSIQGVTIGDGAVVGAGACVTGNLPARQVAVGVPATPIHGTEPR